MTTASVGRSTLYPRMGDRHVHPHSGADRRHGILLNGTLSAVKRASGGVTPLTVGALPGLVGALVARFPTSGSLSPAYALGRLPQLKGHIDFALNLGWSREELGELFMHLVYYCGLPACLNALGVAKEVFDELSEV